MNDAIHYDLCKEFNALLNTLSADELIALIDTEKYYNIFTYNNITNDIIILHQNVKFAYNLMSNVITTRKIANIDNIVYYMIALNEINDIQLFFSIYTIMEIEQILNTEIYKKDIYHNKYGNIRNTGIMTLILNAKFNVLHYILNFVIDFAVFLSLKDISP